MLLLIYLRKEYSLVKQCNRKLQLKISQVNQYTYTHMESGLHYN